MTRNLYLGADLGPAISASTICGAIDAGGTILNDVDASDFPARAKLLAQEIKSSKADLVGLQEVALWREQATSDFTTTPAETVRYDFLQLLLDELKAAGSKYTVAVVQDEFDQELPANTDHNLNTGNGPFGGNAGPTGCGADKDGRLTMRDAIIVKKGSKVKVSNPRDGSFPDPLRGEPRRRAADLRRPRLGLGRRQDQGQEEQGRPDEDQGREVPLRQHPPRGVRRSRDSRGAGP